ncbi:MAG TPA: FkbM family methyltransferase [Steroidobacteraceae bacterium]|nr:FkbM family methyltransferase [Steroidobacteraceae bacterium]
MIQALGLLKPCYVFAPRTLVRRVRSGLFGMSEHRGVVRLPWGVDLEVNPLEGIGRELLHQNIFDIAVSETAWRLLHAGDLAVDVGANIGYTASLFAAKAGRAGRIEAFEPHPRVFRRLAANAAGWARHATMATVTLHECAVGASDGRALLTEPGAFGINEGAARLVPASGGMQVAPLDVRVARLDSVLADAPIALLKVDVEGFEGEVFLGAEGLLKSGRIAHIIYEAHDRERSPLHEQLRVHGYSIFGIGHDLFGPRLTTGAAPPRIDARWESPNYLATLHPNVALPALRPRGWQVLRP